MWEWDGPKGSYISPPHFPRCFQKIYITHSSRPSFGALTDLFIIELSASEIGYWYFHV